ncbi:ATP-binding protein [Mycolicibacterium arseniciresistens]|uniref:Adenylate/guanylate cyclase domain-containing protein n=1 Tax=Mycolicibacterium arseniciresistens TaxID=3062257 RepID=A0ABT8UK38_9MYCO|nr:adenylate/guanylate cyclase domain-containing protein [Mycolicibacterium arseniciresistens]MDO3638162.1 adenylate/guanylate cyclase domain-containing protein [Mycolicibacterium arseniciresistens]
MSTPVGPSGIVTFLFTDIEGSTRRWEADAGGMRVALAEHDESLRQVIDSHGGWLFKHTGDGVCAAFASPRAAIDAAVAAQRTLELPVRMGIATGEAERRGQDYFGVVLNRVARVMSAGHGRQILLAESTAALVGDVGLIRLGPRRLRDVPVPVTIFQVCADGLQTTFPPLRAVGPTPGNLRPQVARLVGRDAVLDEITDTVRNHQVVTLTGVGGVGKTRLALAVAARLENEMPDGVWVIELAAVADPAAVPDAVATVLGITQQPGESLVDTIGAALEDRNQLLVFDNCEHLLEASAALIDVVVAHSATVKILATSREGLGLAEERVRTVPSLGVDAGTASAAVALFAERADAASHRFSMQDQRTADAVLEICHRLDGIPLAIELAASRMASMSAMDVRDHLDQRFRLLTGTRRGLQRHQTLRHAVGWSYELLDDREKAMLTRCSVFVGGFTLASACAVAGSGCGDEVAVLDVLDALVRKSLLSAEQTAGATRYSMLETIREFGEERLAEHGDGAATRSAHARHFAGCERDLLRLWDGPRQREAYAWLDAEWANLRTAFRCAADSGDIEVAAAIACCCAPLGYMVENFEAIAWAEELVEPARTAGHPRLAALCVASVLSMWPGRFTDAVRYSEWGQLAIGDGAGVAFGLEGWLAGPLLAIGEPDRAAAWCRNRLARHPDSHGLVRACLVMALWNLGTVEEATAATEGLLETAESSGNPHMLSFALFAYGRAFRSVDHVRALDAMRRGLAIARESGNRTNESHLAVNMAIVEATHGDTMTALDHVAMAIGNQGDAANRIVAGRRLVILAYLFDRIGRYEPAARLVGFAASPFATAVFPEIQGALEHLQEVLGETRYASLTHAGATTSTNEMVNFAHEQIDQVRSALTRPA